MGKNFWSETSLGWFGGEWNGNVKLAVMLIGMVNQKRYIDISINRYIAEYISICPIYREKYIDILEISEEIYQQIIFS